MPSVNVQSGSPAASINLLDGGGTVTNDGPSTVYYNDELPVTTGSSSLASGASVALTGVQFFTADTRASVRFTQSAAGAASPLWTPAKNSLKAATADPLLAGTAVALATGFPHHVRLPLEDTTGPIANVLVYCSTSTATLTAGQAHIGVYSSGGTLLAQTADLSSGVFNTTGLKTLALVAESGQSLPTGGPGVWVHVCALLVGTMPQFIGHSSASPNALALDAGLGTLTTNARSGHNGGGALTVLPAARPSLTEDTTRFFWAGLS